MSDDEAMRSDRNVYEGYVAGKIYRKGDMRIRLDFNPTVEHKSGEGTRIARFNLRMFEKPEPGHREMDGVEIGVEMTLEQWLDLISAMKAAVKDADGWREMFDKLDPERGEDWDAET
jgi:hypothetical protein